VRYDRELMGTTLLAMKRIAEIKARRERVFYKNRILGKKEKERAESLRDIQRNIELVDVPELKERVKERMLDTPVRHVDVEMA
jgi:large subunit ribosomal protein L24e